MPHLSRFCDGCNSERLFEQFHGDPASCPDAADGDCQEWGCTVCGAALFIGLPAPGRLSGEETSRAALPARGTGPQIIEPEGGDATSARWP
jgi:hypothetical protein